MDRFKSAFRSAASKLAFAATNTMQDMARGGLPQEPEVTAALVVRFKDALNGHTKSGITWSAKILSSHGPKTEEKEFGADFLGVLRLELEGCSIIKGFLAQAKRQEPGRALSTVDWDRLKKQCEKMLSFSAESFVFVYSLNGVFMIPAIGVSACSNSEDLHTLHPKTTSQFYKEHFQCFIGERRIDQTSHRVLEDLRYRHGLEIRADVETAVLG